MNPNAGVPENRGINYTPITTGRLNNGLKKWNVTLDNKSYIVEIKSTNSQGIAKSDHEISQLFEGVIAGLIRQYDIGGGKVKSLTVKNSEVTKEYTSAANKGTKTETIESLEHKRHARELSLLREAKDFRLDKPIEDLDELSNFINHQQENDQDQIPSKNGKKTYSAHAIQNSLTGYKKIADKLALLRMTTQLIREWNRTMRPEAEELREPDFTGISITAQNTGAAHIRLRPVKEQPPTNDDYASFPNRENLQDDDFQIIDNNILEDSLELFQENESDEEPSLEVKKSPQDIKEASSSLKLRKNVRFNFPETQSVFKPQTKGDEVSDKEIENKEVRKDEIRRNTAKILDLKQEILEEIQKKELSNIIYRAVDALPLMNRLESLGADQWKALKEVIEAVESNKKPSSSNPVQEERGRRRARERSPSPTENNDKS